MLQHKLHERLGQSVAMLREGLVVDMQEGDHDKHFFKRSLEFLLQIRFVLCTRRSQHGGCHSGKREEPERLNFMLFDSRQDQHHDPTS